MNPLRWLSALLLALAIVAGAALLLQRQVASQLRAEVALLRYEHDKLARLRAENERLVAAKISEAELATLRSDRAAAVRLRQEIEGLRESLEKRERALAANPPADRLSPTGDPIEREERIRRDNEAKKRAVEDALAAQQRRKQDKLELEASGRK